MYWSFEASNLPVSGEKGTNHVTTAPQSSVLYMYDDPSDAWHHMGIVYSCLAMETHVMVSFGACC